ncbi:MAG: TetR/AcrR family transcriptional regulator [Actinomycetota bacterium]
MPKLWTETIDAHRSAVRDALLDTTAALVAMHGLSAVTMSQVAKETGIGRATLYKYFPDVESILAAWHDRQVTGHLAQLSEVRDRVGDPGERLAAVLHAYALMTFQRPHGTEIAALVHRDEHLTGAHRHLADLIRGLIADAAAAGSVRDDIAAEELAAFCLHALGASGNLTSKAAVQRLVEVTLAGMRPVR